MPFHEIHRGPAFAQLRADHESGDLPDVCRRCLAIQSGAVENEQAFRRREPTLAIAR